MSWLGPIIGFGAILLGNFIEGGHISSLVQGSAFLIVIGGTIGAIFLAHDFETIRQAWHLGLTALLRPHQSVTTTHEPILLDIAKTLKKEGPAVLEAQIEQSITDPFQKKAVRLLIDGFSPNEIEALLQEKLNQEETLLLESAKVWSDAGGYAPTMGILGAVLGLIHVMANLTDTSKLGGGVAVAFVATIYGVAFANLIFLPIASKVRGMIQKQIENKRVFLRGVVGIAGNQTLSKLSLSLHQ
ncbi:MAG: flagellar motor protein [Bdellovibrionaceae bacterium]|nr:flagellar motor protein [Pseudobdellovibrionaceae bacterium]MDW8189381.1 flagellar motor protein [Pseudobdellovibrionaceae bacterium]